MRAAGLDIGSRTVEFVVLEDAAVVSEQWFDTTPDVENECAALLEAAPFDRLIVTGYGRALAELKFDATTVTEIRAHATGAWALFPGCRTVLDVGGQDTKVIALDAEGRVTHFEMNDRCAAGTGKFLETMAGALGFAIDAFGAAALRGSDGLRLSNMCTVFAESEVIGLVTRGEKREDVARAVHDSIHRRNLAMVRRLSPEAPLVFSGGAARNLCLVRLMEDELGLEVLVPERPHMMGAYGAAVIAGGARGSGG
ncbi:MAG: acyl-CoA dehydratase activase [Candidatus Eisenbacteria bacterium]